jgi:hypothetical protein
MVEDDATRDIGKDCAMFFRCANGSVCDLELGRISARPLMWKSRVDTHFTRSKTVTRLPTGDSRHVPSGVKRRLPLL